MTAALEAIALRGNQPVYNVARGRNTSHAEIMQVLQAYTGCSIDVGPGAPVQSFPKIDITRLAGLLPSIPKDVSKELPSLVDAFRSKIGAARHA